MKLDWIPTRIHSSEEQAVVLKNCSTNKLNVNLAIVGTSSDDFVFKTNQKRNTEVPFEVDEAKTILVLFKPLSVGEKLANLTIRVQGLRTEKGKAVKTTLKLKGTCEAEYHTTFVEETLSETLINMDDTLTETLINMDDTRGNF